MHINLRIYNVLHRKIVNETSSEMELVNDAEFRGKLKRIYQERKIADIK